jgi:hypothetical protein
VDRKIGWPTAIPPAVAHGMGKETVLPSVRSGDSEYLSFFALWKENFTQIFSTLPCKEYAGKCWTRTTDTEAARDH